MPHWAFVAEAEAFHRWVDKDCAQEQTLKFKLYGEHNFQNKTETEEE